MTEPADNEPAANSAAPKDAGSNFLRQIVERDLAESAYANRRFAGTPGDAAHHATGSPDPARIRTRFPPEPNGYLHIGHAKSIALNFGLAAEYSAAEALIEAGLAYVDEQNADEMRANRGDFGQAGKDSRFRTRTPAENMARFREMRAGALPDGAGVLRAKLDMASPNINLRDPALYRIKHAEHHNTGNAWCIYPMYAFAHPIEDALEGITHSICTLEFEDQRPWYDWLLDTLCTLGLLAQPRPHQYEFARLNVTYVITSKRKLRQLVDSKIVDGWDDPRMPTIVGLRRRGYTPGSIRLMCERAGTSKAGGWTDYASLDIALREDLEGKAPRAMAVIHPLKLKLTNWAAVFGASDYLEPCNAPANPHRPDLAPRSFGLGEEVWIERDDFAELPRKGFFRLYPGNKVRLKYGCIVECTGCEKDADGNVTTVMATVVHDTKRGTPGADAIKVKGTITWLGVHEALPAELRLYDRLFTEPQPDAGGSDFLATLNPSSKQVVSGYVEPSLASMHAEDKVQFERHGYFVADRVDHRTDRPVFNRIAALKDSWGK